MWHFSTFKGGKRCISANYWTDLEAHRIAMAAATISLLNRVNIVTYWYSPKTNRVGNLENERATWTFCVFFRRKKAIRVWNDAMVSNLTVCCMFLLGLKCI